MIWFTGKVQGYDDWADFTLRDITEAVLNEAGDILYVNSDLGEVPIDPSTIKMGRSPGPPLPGMWQTGQAATDRRQGGA